MMHTEIALHEKPARSRPGRAFGQPDPSVDAPQRSWRPPVPLAEQLHQRWDEQGSHDGRVDQDRERCGDARAAGWRAKASRAITAAITNALPDAFTASTMPDPFRSESEADAATHGQQG
jgi:hypothetical protein